MSKSKHKKKKRREVQTYQLAVADAEIRFVEMEMGENCHAIAMRGRLLSPQLITKVLHHRFGRDVIVSSGDDRRSHRPSSETLAKR
jgi:hypothetical protein